MTPHQTLAVGVRLFAILLALYSIALLASMSAVAAWPPILGTGLLFMAAVLGLWLFPKSVARKLLAPEREATPIVEPTGTEPWFRVGCALIGIWLFSNALPKVASALAVLSDPSTNNESTVRWLFPMFVQIAVAAWLFFGNRGLVLVYRWAQDAGRTRAP